MGRGCVGALLCWLSKQRVESSCPSKGKEGRHTPGTSERAGQEVELQDVQQRQPQLPPSEAGVPEDVLAPAVEGGEGNPQEASLPSQASRESLQGGLERASNGGSRSQVSSLDRGSESVGEPVIEIEEVEFMSPGAADSAGDTEEEEAEGQIIEDKINKKGSSLLSMFRKLPRSGSSSEGGVHEHLRTSGDEMERISGTTDDLKEKESLSRGTSAKSNGDDEAGGGKGQSIGFVIGKKSMKKSPSFAAFSWRMRSKKQPGSPNSGSEEDNVRLERQLSTSSAPAGDSEAGQGMGLAARNKGGFACFRWGQPMVLEDGDDDDEIIQGNKLDEDLTPPGLVGLSNLGNTCFLNAAFQCLRCTPGLAELLVPEFKNGFSSTVSLSLSEGSDTSYSWKRSKRSFSLPDSLASITQRPGISAALEKQKRVLPWQDIALALWDNPTLGHLDSNNERAISLPVQLSSFSGLQLPVEDTGLVGGSSTKQVCSRNMWRAAREDARLRRQSKMPFSVFSAYQNGNMPGNSDENDRTVSSVSTALIPHRTDRPNNEGQIEMDDVYIKVNIHVLDVENNNSDAVEPPGYMETQGGHSISENLKNKESSSCDCNLANCEIAEVKRVETTHSLQSTTCANYSTSRSNTHVNSGIIPFPLHNIEKPACQPLQPVRVTLDISSSVGLEPGGEVAEVKDANVNIKTEDSLSSEVRLMRLPEASKSADVKRSRDFGEHFIVAFRKTIVATCTMPPETHFNPKALYKRLGTLPQGELFCDGGQHDCQETIEVLLNLVHDQLNCAQPQLDRVPDTSNEISEEQNTPKDKLGEEQKESLKAEAFWENYLRRDCSPITDLFAGQLQIVRTCQKCSARTTTYEPFWGLSLPLAKEKSGWFGGRGPSCIEDLLRAFTAGEAMQGDEGPFCEGCNQKCNATRRIQIHRFPPMLILNIKRFKYTKDGREKLTSNISYPVRGLKLQNYASRESRQVSTTPIIYDLYASSNHFGTLNGGHYTAYCKVKDASSKESWHCFNDHNVRKINEDEVVTPNAYVLFYSRRR